MKLIKNILFHRITYLALAFGIQLVLLIGIILRFSRYFVYFYGISVLLSLFVVVLIVNKSINPSYKLVWIIPILLFPVFGGLFYIMFGNYRLSKKNHLRMEKISNQIDALLQVDGLDPKKSLSQSGSASCQSRYIQKASSFPPMTDTGTEFFPIGEEFHLRLLEELSKAQHYIFLEYFIIQEGTMWNSILDILKEKAAQGLDIRVIYDDVGCLMTLPRHYDKELRKWGIKACVFNPLVPVLSALHNNRDHRKIGVIDGRVAFTGGINLADEYINQYEKHGHWKDTAIRMTGGAAWSMTLMFLSLWGFLQDTDEDFAVFYPEAKETVLPSDGVVQPFMDSPLDEETVGESVYLNMISKAEKYVYISSPYLIIDNEMITALTNAAKSGVDVRIITPGVPDKRIIHAVTRSFYPILLQGGVRIFEYTPGFIHSKVFLSDDRFGVVGTINCDFRSLYLHFECGAWLHDIPALSDIYKDFGETFLQCQEVTQEQLPRNPLKNIGSSILRLFAPFL